MKVGDLVRGAPATSNYSDGDSTGIILGVAAEGSMLLVKWNDLSGLRAEPRHYLKVINASR